MNRKPRHKKKDRLVNQQLAIYSYLHIGMRRVYHRWPSPYPWLITQEPSQITHSSPRQGRRTAQKSTRTRRPPGPNTALTSGSSAFSGLMQALGAFLVYFTVYAQQGFWPTSLINLRVAWETDDINDLEDSYGQEWVSQESFHHLALLSSHCPPILSLNLHSPE